MFYFQVVQRTSVGYNFHFLSRYIIKRTKEGENLKYLIFLTEETISKRRKGTCFSASVI